MGENPKARAVPILLADQPNSSVMGKRGIRKATRASAGKKQNNPKHDRCYNVVKAAYGPSAFPSAYASGALVKCRAGKSFKKKK